MSIGKEDTCFIAMPHGRSEEEVRWFRGWYQQVIEPAVREASFNPILSSNEEKPSAINDEIRKHLVLDPMVVVDLGGVTPDDPPNPNVMYELGMRHAMNMPMVTMAWKGQELPFDINNQRAIITERDMLDIDNARRRLKNFIVAAKAGDFYRPMDAVGRAATLDAAFSTQQDDVLRALVSEVSELKGKVAGSRRGLESELSDMRVFELAKELGVKSKYIVEQAEALGFNSVVNHMSPLPRDLVWHFRRVHGGLP